MFALSPATQIYLAAGVTDLRQGFDGLAGAVKAVLASDPLNGHLFLFCNRSRTRLKLLFWDGSGLWLCTKRLEQGRYSWPGVSPTGERRVRLHTEELALLVGGLELGTLHRKDWYRREPAAT